MDREERIEKLRHLITCMKCEVSGKCCDDNCSTQYDAGNMGEIIENLEEIAKALEQEPCTDAISRDSVLDFIADYDLCMGEVVKRIHALPPVTSQTKTGHWIMPVQDDGMSDPIFYQVRCSKCGFDLDPQTWYEELKQYGADKFCPKCGASMTESENKCEKCEYYINPDYTRCHTCKAESEG